jgi:hypothetical protein
MHTIALAVARGANAGKNTLRDPSGERAPRTYVFDEAFSVSWDESILNGAGPSRLPGWWRLAREVQKRHAQYDAVVSWGERLSLALLLEQQWARVTKPHIALMYQFEKPNIRIPFSLLKRNLHAVVTWSTVQRRALIDRIGYPAERVYLIRHYVDQVFYSPRDVEEDMICSVGAEMRDYVTLLEALRGSGVPCHVAADHVRIPGQECHHRPAAVARAAQALCALEVRCCAFVTFRHRQWGDRHSRSHGNGEACHLLAHTRTGRCH